MSKQISRNREIYLAPDILGKYRGDTPIVIDKRNNGQELDPTKLDDKIIIFQREVEGWFLEPATNLPSNLLRFENSFIVLMVCMAYLEGIQQYINGQSSRGQSRIVFVESVRRLYPTKNFDERHIKKLYKKVRSGLFHNGMVSGGVIFNNDDFREPLAFEDDGNTILINSCLLLKDIKKDFEDYINILKDPAKSEERCNFNKMYKLV